MNASLECTKASSPEVEKHISSKSALKSRLHEPVHCGCCLQARRGVRVRASMGSEVEAPQSVVQTKKKRSTRGGVKLRLKKERQRAAAEAAEAVNHTAAPTAASGQPPDVVGRRRRGGGQGRGGSQAAAAANGDTVTSAPQRSVQPAPGQGCVRLPCLPQTTL